MPVPRSWTRRWFLVLSLLLLGLLGPALAQGTQRPGDPYPPGTPGLGTLGFIWTETAEGRRIDAVLPDTPASDAGLLRGDLVLGEVTPWLFPRRAVGEFRHLAAGEVTTLRIRRGGQVRTVELEWAPVTLEFLEPFRAAAQNLEVLNGRVDVVTPGAVGVELQLPLAAAPRMVGSKVWFLQDRQRLGFGRVARAHDAWRVVVDFLEPHPVVRPGQKVEIVLQAPAPGWAGWVPTPKGVKPKPTHRVLRLSRRQLELYMKPAQEHFARLVQSVPRDQQARVRGVQLVLDSKDPQVNAYATHRKGIPIVAITGGMGETVLFLSFNRVNSKNPSDMKKALEHTTTMAILKGIGDERTPMPRGFLTKMRSRSVADEVARTAASMFTFILGHELGHHSLGHLPGASLNPAVESVLADFAASRQQEFDADEWGGYSIKWTKKERGPVLFFARFMALSEAYEEYALPPVYLRTHPEWSTRADRLEILFDRLGQS